MRIRSLAPLGALALLPAAQLAQGQSATPLPLKYDARPTSSAITVGDLMSRLYVFADDSLMGREAGTIGHMMGTDYIARQAEKLGLIPAGDSGTFFQNVPFISRRFAASTMLVVEGGALAGYTDVIALPFRGAGARPLEGVQVIYGGTAGDTANALTAEQAAGKLVVLSVPQGAQMRMTPNLAGAAAIATVVGDRFTPQQLLTGRTTTMTLRPAPDAPLVMTGLLITSRAAQTLMGAPLAGLATGTLGKTIRGDLRYVVADAPTRNVVAILPGTDRVLRNQFVAIGAHSDHVGIRAAGPVDHDSLHAFGRQRWLASENPTGAPRTPEQMSQLRARIAAIKVNVDSMHGVAIARRDSINNGADDDGSGTVTVLEVAEAFARGRVKPKRSLLFVWHTAEEKGLLGSRYYTDNPTVPRDSIVAQINIDMVGRGAASDLAAGGPTYLQLVGSRRLSKELGDLVETVNKGERMPFTFDYAFDANGHPDNIYCRSDHYNYARYGIPVVFLTTGLHGDYHQVTDEPQYIDYPHMQRIGTFVFNLTNRIAGLAKRPLVDQPKPDPMGSCRQ